MDSLDCPVKNQACHAPVSFLAGRPATENARRLVPSDSWENGRYLVGQGSQGSEYLLSALDSIPGVAQEAELAPGLHLTGSLPLMADLR